jgi:uncharacterized membrane protein
MKKSISVLGLGLALLIIILGSKVHAQVNEYDFTQIDVPFPGAFDTQVIRINELGHIVGIYFDGNRPGAIGFVSIGGVFNPVDAPGAVLTNPMGINNLGYIVGNYYDAVWQGHGFSKVGDTFATIDLPGAATTSLYDINETGSIVGSYFDTKNHGFVKIGDSFVTIDFPEAGSLGTQAFGLNNSSHIVGQYYDGSNRLHGFLKIGDTYTTIDFPLAIECRAFDINDFGHIVGSYVDQNNGRHGFLKVGDEFTTIDFPGGWGTTAFGINNSGQIVGSFGGIALHGFLASPHTPEQEIDDIQNFFDNSVNKGTLIGVGTTPQAANGKLVALRNMLDRAEYFIDNGLVSEACQQLRDAYLKTDGQPRPSDLVSGDGASELASIIQDLMANLECQ